MMKGVVKRWLNSYGFIGTEEMNEDIFVHASDIEGRVSLAEGEKVEFDVKATDRGPRAVNVRSITEEEG